jgi:hypothetical protein
MAQSTVDGIPLDPSWSTDNQLFKTRVRPSALDESQISVIIFLEYLPIATDRQATKYEDRV